MVIHELVVPVVGLRGTLGCVKSCLVSMVRGWYGMRTTLALFGE